MENEKIEAKLQLQDYFGKDPIMFLKFGNDPGRLEQIREGSLYMNNLKFYIDREEETGEAGLGDRLEALNVINDVDISVYDSQTNQLLVSVPAESASTRYDEALTKPVFCLYAVTVDILEVAEVEEKRIVCKLTFSNEDLASMKEEFGEYALVIMAEHFTERIKKAFEDKKYKYRAKMVEYADYSINDSERMEKHYKGHSDLFFYKDKAFAHQEEYRVVILNKDIEHGYSEKIPSLQNASGICNIDALSIDNGVIWNITKNPS
jgi:hypothetical protein